MKVSVRNFKNKGQSVIKIKKLGKKVQAHSAGTVVLRKVAFGKAVMGTMVEETERAYFPSAEDGMFTRAVKNWDRARFVSSLGGYYNMRTGQRVVTAEYVYMVGNQIFYTN